jgi:hypothetical protein
MLDIRLGTRSRFLLYHHRPPNHGHYQYLYLHRLRCYRDQRDLRDTWLRCTNVILTPTLNLNLNPTLTLIPNR